jgi:hypothetical protein
MARRLLSSDLATVERALKDAQDNLRRWQDAGQGPPHADQQWPVGREGAAWSQSWAAHRQSLAIVLDDRRFQDLATGFGFVEHFQHSLAAGRRPFRYEDAGFLENVRDAVIDAKAAISA